MQHFHQQLKQNSWGVVGRWSRSSTFALPNKRISGWPYNQLKGHGTAIWLKAGQGNLARVGESWIVAYKKVPNLEVWPYELSLTPTSVLLPRNQTWQPVQQKPLWTTMCHWRRKSYARLVGQKKQRLSPGYLRSSHTVPGIAYFWTSFYERKKVLCYSIITSSFLEWQNASIQNMKY